MFLMNEKELAVKEEERSAARMQRVQASLARLLATENLAIQFKKAHTASMDLDKRVLTIPLYSMELNDATVTMLVGHEVGHARWTPVEGWHDSLCKRGKAFKHYLNVVEDVRIERLIKDKYPGLNKDFFIGYADLWKKNFFGDHVSILSHLGSYLLIDKLNLFAKVGAHIGNFGFSAEEQELITAAETADTWEQVNDVANRIFVFDKAKRKAMKEAMQNQPQQGGSPDEKDDLDDMGDSRGEEESQESRDENAEEGDDDLSDMDDEGSENGSSGDYDDSEDDEGDESDADGEGEGDDDSDAGEEGDDEEEGKGSGKNGEEKEEGDDEGKEAEAGQSDKNDGLNEEEVAEEKSKATSKQAGRNKQGSEGQVEEIDEDPESETDAAFRRNQDKLLDSKAFGDYRSIDVVEIPEYHDYMVGYKDWFKKRAADAAGYDFTMEDVAKQVAKIGKKHGAYITHLVREFEMRKNAWAQNRAREASSGTLNLTKLHEYRFNDDIFKKITMTPKGKNHGLLMFIDCSGSMRDSIKSVLEQAVVLAMFCRKVSIPFRVYGFTDAYRRGAKNARRGSWRAESTSEGHIQLGRFNLVEVLSEKMSIREFNRAVAYCVGSTPVPLGGTPLNESIIVSAEVIAKFKAETSAEKVTAVFLTDGDGTSAAYPDFEMNVRANVYKDTMVVKSPWSRKQYEVAKTDSANGGTGWTRFWISMMQKETGATYIGYFVAPARQVNNMINQYSQYCSKSGDAMRLEFRNKRYISIDDYGYSEYFLLHQELFRQQDDTIETVAFTTTKALAKAFTNVHNMKAANRVFLTEFCKLIA